MDTAALFEQTALVHFSFLQRMAVRITRNEDDAQDLVQDTLLSAYRAFHTYKPGTNCRAWLCRILKNTRINRYRRQRRRPAEVDFDTIEEVLESHIRETSLKPCDPEEALLHGVLKEDVRRAFEELPPPFRRTLSLAVVGGYSYREIADIMSCPIGTVMSRTHRARVLTQQRLLPHAQGRPWAGGSKRNGSGRTEDCALAVVSQGHPGARSSAAAH